MSLHEKGFRSEGRVPLPEEQTAADDIEALALEFCARIDRIGASRELSMAKTKIEEATMWANHHIRRAC